MNLSQNESVHGNLWVTEKPQRLFPSFLYTCTEVLICIKSSTRIFSFLPFVHAHLHRIIISNLYKEIYRCYRWRTGLSPSFFPCTCTKDLLLCYFPGTWCSPQRTYSICFITSVAKEYRSVDVYFTTESVPCTLRTSTKHTGLRVSKASAWD